MADGAVPIPRSRLPLPPVPVGPGAAHAAGPVLSAVPTPELPGGPAGRGPDTGGGAALPRPARVWPQGEPELPRQTTPAGAPSPAYGDWTKPSRTGEPFDVHLADGPSARLLVPAAPATTMIPERPVNRGRGAAGGDDVALAEAPAPHSGEFPAPDGPTGPSGRAAMRAQRQAADMARRKAAKRAGDPVGVPDDEPARGPRRVVTGLLAMVVVALGVLGVYGFVVPTQEASSDSAIGAGEASSAPTQTAVLPPLETSDLEVAVPAAPVTPVLAPVTVLNATDVNGMAADVAAVMAAGGWETSSVGTYLADDVATSTVFYTAGDETQRQAAESLRAQFPQLLTTAERFFEVPADVAAPGLVVVLAAPW